MRYMTVPLLVALIASCKNGAPIQPAMPHTLVDASTGIEIAVSSVFFAENCAERKGMSALPCKQSSIQFAFDGELVSERTTAKLVLLRLVDGKSTRLTRITFREPTYWLGNAYESWDQFVPAGSMVKSSYKFEVGDSWEKLLGDDGGVAIIEATFAIAGSLVTVYSKPVFRVYPATIIT